MQTVEQWQTYSVAPVLISWPAAVGFGIKHTINVDENLPERFIWLGVGKIYQETVNNAWWAQVRINFMRGGNVVGSLLYGDHSDGLTTLFTSNPGRPLFRHVAGGQGAVQPPLVAYSFSAPAPFKNYLELPCFHVRVVCDRVVYEIEKANNITGGANPDEFLTGLRVVSMPLIQ